MEMFPIVIVAVTDSAAIKSKRCKVPLTKRILKSCSLLFGNFNDLLATALPSNSMEVDI